MASYNEFVMTSIMEEEVASMSGGQYFSEAYVSYPDSSEFSNTTLTYISPDHVGWSEETLPNIVVFSFDMDYNAMIMEKSPFGTYIANTVILNPDILEDVLSKITIESVTITRKRVDVEEAAVEIVTGTPGGVGILDPAAEQDTDAILGEQWTVMHNDTSIALHATGKLFATIEEVQMITADGTYAGYSSFMVNDFQFPDEGEYEYEVKVSFSDLIGEYLASLLEVVASSVGKLEEYFAEALYTCSFDSTWGAFAEFFVEYQLQRYGTLDVAEQNADGSWPESSLALESMEDASLAPWICPVVTFLQASQYFSIEAVSTAAFTEVANALYYDLNPNTATPTSISEVITVLQEFIYLQLETYDLGSSLPVHLAGFSAGASEGEVAAATVNVYATLDGHAYGNSADISNTYGSLWDKNEGNYSSYRTITRSEYINRINRETSKYFADFPANGSDPITNINKYKTAYLTPQTITTANGAVNTNPNGKGNWNPSEYRNAALNIVLAKMDLSSAGFSSTSTENVGASILEQSGISVRLASDGSTVNPMASKAYVDVKKLLTKDTNLSTDKTRTPAEKDQTTSKQQISMSTLAMSIASQFAASGISDGNINDIGTMAFDAKYSTHRKIKNYDTSVVGNVTEEEGIGSLMALPQQIKSLFKSNSSVARVNWHSMNSDPISSCITSAIFELNYFNIYEVYVMHSYESSETGNNLMANPVWSLLDSDTFYGLGAGKYLCKISKYQNQALGMGSDTLYDIPNTDGYFWLEI